MCLPRALFYHGLQYRFLFHQSSTKERVANLRDAPFDKMTSGLLLLEKNQLAKDSSTFRKEFKKVSYCANIYFKKKSERNEKI